MAQVIYGDDSTFSALAFGVPHPGTISYLAERFEQASSSLMQMGNGLLEYSQQVFDRFNSDDAIRLAQAALRKVQTAWQQDMVYSMNNIADFQHAQPIMIRWLMANPEVRDLYHGNRLDGYSHFYTDAQPTEVGFGHYDYHRVMDGMVVVNETPGNGEPDWYADTFYDELLPDDGDLTLEDQSMILESWRAMNDYIRLGKDDPTSKFNAEME